MPTIADRVRTNADAIPSIVARVLAGAFGVMSTGLGGGTAAAATKLSPAIRAVTSGAKDATTSATSEEEALKPVPQPHSDGDFPGNSAFGLSHNHDVPPNWIHPEAVPFHDTPPINHAQMAHSSMRGNPPTLTGASNLFGGSHQ